VSIIQEAEVQSSGMSLKKKKKENIGSVPKSKKNSHNLLTIPKLVSKRPESKSRTFLKKRKRKKTLVTFPKQ
jgi:hypothetical protein